MFILVFGFLSLTSCTKNTKKELWVYSSMYQEMIEMMKPDVKRAFPNIKIQWFAAGSEKIAAKINAELAANRLQADILMTSDPFFYLELKQKELLLKYESPNTKSIPPILKDTDGFFVTQRVPVMLLAYNRNMLTPSQIPKTFKELTDSRWKGKIAMGSPLESGTMFTAVASLVEKYGWDFFKKLRENQVLSAGGNAAVRQKLEAKEYPIGIILLENILQAQDQGSPLEPIYPEDGVILVPSPVAIFKRTLYVKEAQQLIDFLFSEIGQRAMVKAKMYSPNPSISPPIHARAFGSILKTAFPWSSNFSEKTFSNHQTIKETFSKIMFE